jgi:hypothetical protein
VAYDPDSVKIGVVKLFDDLNEAIDLSLVELIIRFVAELAKDESCRNLLIENKVFQPLNKQLMKLLLTSKHYPVKIQLCRAIGNLCYDNGKCNRMLFNIF